MSPSAHNPSLVCRPPKCQAADCMGVCMTEAAASVGRQRGDHRSLLVLLLECPHQVVEEHCWTHWRQVLKHHLLLGLRSSPSLEQMEFQGGPNICLRMQRHQKTSPHFFFWLRLSLSLGSHSTLSLYFGAIPLFGFLRQTQQHTRWLSLRVYSLVSETGLLTSSETLMRGICTHCLSWTAGWHCRGCLWQTGIFSSLASLEVWELNCQTVGSPEKKNKAEKSNSWINLESHITSTRTVQGC